MVQNRTGGANSRSASHEEVDPSTGKPLFVPSVGRAPKRRQKEKDEPIGNYLYSLVKVNADLQSAKQLLRETEKKYPIRLVREKSREIVAKLHNAAFKKIFAILDSDQDGSISAGELDFSSNIS